MNLDVAATNAQNAGRQAVRDAMEARGRDSPWEISEAWIKIAIMQSFLAEARKSTSRAFRAVDELSLDQIANIICGPAISMSHPVDIVLLYPLLPTAQGSVDPWGDANRYALGLVEIKKDYTYAIKDAELLSQLNSVKKVTRPLKWELLAVFINGASEKIVNMNADDVANKVGKYGFSELTGRRPEESPRYSQPAEPVGDHWFDFMCYGRLFDAA